MAPASERGRRYSDSAGMLRTLIGNRFWVVKITSILLSCDGYDDAEAESSASVQRRKSPQHERSETDPVETFSAAGPEAVLAAAGRCSDCALSGPPDAMICAAATRSQRSASIKRHLSTPQRSETRGEVPWQSMWPVLLVTTVLFFSFYKTGLGCFRQADKKKATGEPGLPKTASAKFQLRLNARRCDPTTTRAGMTTERERDGRTAGRARLVSGHYSDVSRGWTEVVAIRRLGTTANLVLNPQDQ
ncbi:hypothetical protein BDV96DRAFT_259696 [Lophiotrema nucula]|uniref:Uncharacterized protein n=1 Tax=Lophiotrema nucula TaxID=690887 RepID=A0A6A5YNB0_9PLEO|nr:hypothetical protein BDV96DRAFT_259696 [Lophiotrema nucula]